ncbi:hypothetical protein [Streptosporangium jomthongense]|uniref:Uncharacterized protein n=1 Tax=Streptosporangium jomthongense TaxID=1193683 RepID=A0ABV8F5H3_9ACTN
MSDIKTVAFSVEALQAVQQLEKRFSFNHQLDLGRLGFAYAVQHRLDLDRGSGFGTPGRTGYNEGSIDPDRLMRSAVKIFYPDSQILGEPLRAVETLMSKGLILLLRHLEEGVIGSLSDIVPGYEESDESLKSLE